MLTEMQDSATISYWFNSLIQSGFKVPRAAVTDRSPALENALSMSFNWIPFVQFNEECLLILLGQKKMNSSLRCWIRNDIAHLIKSVCQWQCFVNNKVTKSFYCRIIGFMSTIENFEILKEVAKAVFVVASSKFYTEKVRASRKYLTGLIRTYKYDLPNDLQGLVQSDVAEEIYRTEGEVLVTDSDNDDGADDGHGNSAETVNPACEIGTGTKKTSKRKKKDLLGQFVNDLKLDPPSQRVQNTFDQFQYPHNELESPSFVASFSLLLRYNILV